MSSYAPYPREGSSCKPVVPRSLQRWSRCFGALFAAGTFASMVASADWKLWTVLTDPLAWMMLILASAAGVTAGYAVGCRVLARQAS